MKWLDIISIITFWKRKVWARPGHVPSPCPAAGRGQTGFHHKFFFLTAKNLLCIWSKSQCSYQLISENSSELTSNWNWIRQWPPTFSTLSISEIFFCSSNFFLNYNSASRFWASYLDNFSSLDSSLILVFNFCFAFISSITEL